MFWKRSGASELRAVAMREWDPIGVADWPEAADEYDSYLGPIASQFREGSSAEDVARYLEFVRTQLMGLPADKRRDEHAAECMAAWYAEAVRS